MATTVTWGTKVINVVRADMLLVQSVPTEIRELDTDAFRLELKALEAGVEGMPFIDTHTTNAPVTVGGVTLARTLEIINGYTITFEDGQYAVNLSGTNNNIGDVTNVNQVSIRSANSAGLTFSKEVEDQSFAGAMIWINNEVGQAGTQFPQGTPGFPVLSFEDADIIKAARSLPARFHVHGMHSPATAVSFSDHTINADSATNTKLTFDSNNTSEAVFFNIGVAGTVSGGCSFTDCRIDSLNNFSGRLVRCGLNGLISVAASIHHSIIDCHSHVAGTTTPAIDCNNIPNIDLSIRNYSGGIEIRNFSDSSSNISIDLQSGHVVLDSSVTGGTIVIRGVGHVTNNSSVTPIMTGLTFGTSGLTATESTQLSQIDILRKLMQNRLETDPVTGVLTIYDDDDTTIFLQGNIYEDVLAAQAYRGRGLERRDKLA